VTSILIQILSLALPLLTGVLVDRVVPRGDYHLLTVLSVGLLSIVAFRLMASMVRAHLLLSLQTHLDAQMTLDFVRSPGRPSVRLLPAALGGDLMMRLNSNTTVREILTSSTLSGLLDGALVSLYLVLLFANQPVDGTPGARPRLLRVGIFLLTAGATAT